MERWGGWKWSVVRGPKMLGEFFFIAKMSVFKVGDESGKSGMVHRDAPDGGEDSSVLVRGKSLISQNSGGVRAGAKVLKQKFRTREQAEKESDC